MFVSSEVLADRKVFNLTLLQLAVNIGWDSVLGYLVKILSNSHRSALSYPGFTPLRKAECNPLLVPFCFEYTNILCVSMSDRMQNLQIFIFRCMGEKQLELKPLRMKKSLNRSIYVGHINSFAFRHVIQMLQSTLENINCLKKPSKYFFTTEKSIIINNIWGLLISCLTVELTK